MLFSRLTEPFVDFIRYMPAPAFGTLLVAILGTQEAPKVAMIFVGTFFQMVLVLANTTRQMDPALLEAAQTLGADNRRLLTRVVVPGVLPRSLRRHAHPARLGVDLPDRRRADRREERHHAPTSSSRAATSTSTRSTPAIILIGLARAG